MKGIGFKLTRVKLIVYKTRTSPNRTIRNNEEISLNETQVKMIMFHRNSTADNRIIKHIEEINEDRTCIRRRTTDGKIFIHQRNPAYCGSSEAKKQDYWYINEILSNFNSSNIFRTMDICSRYVRVVRATES